MTLDQARIAKGITIGKEDSRIKVINILHNQQKSQKEIDEFLKQMDEQPLTNEEIEEFGL